MTWFWLDYRNPQMHDHDLWSNRILSGWSCNICCRCRERERVVESSWNKFNTIIINIPLFIIKKKKEKHETWELHLTRLLANANSNLCTLISAEVVHEANIYEYLFLVFTFNDLRALWRRRGGFWLYSDNRTLNLARALQRCRSSDQMLILMLPSKNDNVFSRKTLLILETLIWFWCDV